MECMADVTAKIISAEAPSYATVMDLDRKVREFPMPEDAPAMAASAGLSSDKKSSSPGVITRHVRSHAREVGEY